MDAEEIKDRRLAVQRLSDQRFEHIDEAVRSLLAVQAQDLEPALWSVAMRTKGAVLKDVEEALDEGRILRTHVLRPTWHLVHRDDLRWLLTLTAPRVQARNRHRYRQLDLDATILSRSLKVLADATDGRCLTRSELADALAAAGIPATGQRLAYIVMCAELEQVLCSGRARGRQQTYARFDRRVPPGAADDREELLRLLARRFVAGHGPATRGDLQGWASLTAADAVAALELASDVLERATVDGREHHVMPSPRPASPPRPTVHLLQPYDEYVSGAADSRAVCDPAGLLAAARRPSFSGLVLLDGRVTGSWRRTLRRDGVLVEAEVHEPFATDRRIALEHASERYAAFREVTLQDLRLLSR